ncbi:MAG: HAMP domain-containing histidine kinase [Propionibacteriaceae bacterium]|nr:HAMP domain-containing histidine kinase [Propionibacteriaceae bacterium]
MGWLASAIRTFAHRVRTSLRYRLVFLTALTIVSAAAISGVGTYQAARVSLYSQLDLELLSIAEKVASQLAFDFQGSTVSETTSLDAQNVVAVVVAANGNKEILVGDREEPLITGAAEIAVARIQAGSSVRNGVSEASVTYRVVAVPFTDASNGDAYALVIARVLGPTSAGLYNLSLLQWFIGICAVLLSCVAAIFVAGATLNPIRDLTEVVQEVTSTQELSTIDVRGAMEVADLQLSFNKMMDSLVASRSQQNRFIADAGHELRTPLTSLRTNVELLIADEGSQMLPEGARKEILSDVAAQLGEFTSLINDLVALSRGQSAPDDFQDVDFAEVVHQAVERVQRRGPNLTYDVVLEDIFVRGDAASLERAVTNLLDNAVKYSPVESTITVRLSTQGLVISDEGPGIAAEDLPHIYERFYRSDLSRHAPGTGLGLSIVDQTITAHGGTIDYQTSPAGGAQFTIRIPHLVVNQEPPYESPAA